MTWEHQTTVEVRFSDLDMNGHVNHVAYLTWAEVARARHLASLGASPAALVQNYMAVVILSLTVDYQRELREAPSVDCATSYAFGARKSFTANTVISYQGTVVCSVRTVLGLMNLRDRRLHNTPQEHMVAVMAQADTPTDEGAR